MMPRQKRKIGRPSLATPKTIEAIVDALVNSNRGLVDICNRDRDLPAWKTVWQWMDPNDSRHIPGFEEKITRAKAIQAERQLGAAYGHLVDVLDEIKQDDLSVKFAGIKARHAESMVNAAVKLAGQRAPRVYGPAVKLEHSADDGLAEQLDRMAERMGEKL